MLVQIEHDAVFINLDVNDHFRLHFPNVDLGSSPDSFLLIRFKLAELNERLFNNAREQLYITALVSLLYGCAPISSVLFQPVIENGMKYVNLILFLLARDQISHINTILLLEFTTDRFILNLEASVMFAARFLGLSEAWGNLGVSGRRILQVVSLLILFLSSSLLAQFL